MEGGESILQVDEHELDRLKAQNRALLMSKLFQKDFFEEVVEAINNPDRKKGGEIFRKVAIEKAGLTEPQMQWLWNYLRHYNKDLAWNQSSPKNGW